MPRWLRNNGLAVAMLGAFLVFLVLQSVFGWQTHNEELTEFGAAPLSWPAYLTSGHFAEAVFENWESEFLQMGGYVLLTAYLVQRGSASRSRWTRPTGRRTTSAGPPRSRPGRCVSAVCRW